jgi:hypothetical protein
VDEDDEDATSADTPSILSKPRDLQVMAKSDVELPCETEQGGLYLANIYLRDISNTNAWMFSSKNNTTKF